MADKIRNEKSWEDRFDAHCGCLQSITALADARTLDPMEVCEEIRGALAKAVIEAMAAPPVTEIHQALLYFASSAPAPPRGAVARRRPTQCVAC